MRRAFFILFFLFTAIPAAAQFTAVTGTIVDPNGIPYANGTITPTLTGISGACTFQGFPISGNRGPTSLDATGSFSLSLPDNNVISCAGTKWQFTVSCGAGCIPISGGTGPQSFTVTLTITGASQSISAQLQAAAPALAAAPKTLFLCRFSNIRQVDKANLCGWAGSDPVAWINSAIADLPAAGGVVDARGLADTNITTTNKLVVGTATKAVALLVDHRVTTITFNITDGTSDAICIDSGSSIVSDSTGTATINGFKVASTFNGASLLAPCHKDGTQEFFYARGLTLTGNMSATLTQGMLDLTGVYDASGLENSVIQCFPSVGAFIHTTSNGQGFGPAIMTNVWINGSAGCTVTANTLPVKITTSNAAGFFRGLVWNGSSITFQGTTAGQPVVDINGNGTGALTGIVFNGTYVENHLGTGNGIRIADCRSCLFNNVSFGGVASSGDGFLLNAGTSVTNATIITPTDANPVFTNLIHDTVNSFSSGVPVNGQAVMYAMQGTKAFYLNGGIIRAVGNSGFSIGSDSGFNRIDSAGTAPFPFRPLNAANGIVGFETNGSKLDEQIAPAGVTSAAIIYSDSTLHGVPLNYNNGGYNNFLPKTVALTADWTCGTGGTVASCTSATIIGSGGGVPLTFNLPLVANSLTVQCDGVVGQATAVTANQWNLLTATNGATNVTANYTMATAATAFAAGAVTDQASTTTTFQIAPSWTLGAIGTKMPFHIYAKVEGASASGTILSLQLVAPTVGDLVTIYRGTSCTIF